MTIGSLAAAAMEVLVFLGVGWDNALFNCLLLVTILSSLGLIVGTVGLLAGRKWSIVVLTLSSAYVPVAFFSLTLLGYAAPSAWWLLLPLSLVEIGMGISAFRSRRSITA